MKTNASPWHSYALLVLFKKHLLIFLLILLTIGFNSCKKDLLVNKLPQANINKEKIKSISYNEFLSSINLEKTGVLKASLSNAGKVGHGKLMNNNLGSNALAFDTDSVKKLKLGDTVSYVISLKPETPHAVQFRNLTIQLLNKKTTAFLTTYLPTQEFVKAYKLNKKTSFKGEIFVNKILLEVLPQITGLSTVKNNSNGKLMSLNANDVLLNNNKISLAPGECEIYDVYVTTWLPCFEGHETRDPGDCNYFTTYNTWDLVNNWDYPPGFYDVYSSTVVNCAPPSTGSGDGGGTGGGVTTPNPPGGYDPCDCETPTVSAVGENKGGLKLAVGAPNCCDEGGGGTGGGLPPLVDDDTIIPSWEQTYSEELGRVITFGEISQVFQDNPNLMDAIDAESEDIDNCCGGYLLRPLGIESLIDVSNEVKALKTLHTGWSPLRIYTEAYWNVTKGKLHFLLDVAGLFPVAGEPFDLANGAIYFFEGNKLDAALSLGSAIPVWGWISTGGKWVKIAITAKPIGHAVTGLAFKVQKTAKGGVRFIRVAANTFSHTAITALKAVKPADNTLTNLSRSLVDQASYRIKPALQSLQNKVNDIKLHGDGAGTSLAGKKTEALSDEIFETNGFIKHEAQFGSGNGFDGVYIKKDGAGNVQEIIINEAKPVGAAGNIKLNRENLGTGLKSQMSDGWISDVIDKMIDQGGSLSALAAVLNANKTKITKTVTGVDKATGEIVVLKLANY